MDATDTAAIRADLLRRWASAASGWGKRASRIREMGMPISTRMIELLALQPGERVLELAAGPGDTGFFAAEMIRPGGTLISSDAAEPMLDIARERARQLEIDNVEFKLLELEWIDLPTASVDAVLCRWALMLVVDPAAALAEMRRVLRPGGRLAVAVWDAPEHNPWATIPTRALVSLGHAEPPDPQAPGMFALAGAGRLEELLRSAGFVEAQVESVEIGRWHESSSAYIAETLDLSRAFADVYERLSDDDRAAVNAEIGSLAGAYSDGETLALPGRSLVAIAGA